MTSSSSPVDISSLWVFRFCFGVYTDGQERSRSGHAKTSLVFEGVEPGAEGETEGERGRERQRERKIEMRDREK